MRIEFKKKCKSFSVLDKGATFVYEGLVFMKVTESSAVNLVNGEIIGGFHPDQQVEDRQFRLVEI